MNNKLYFLIALIVLGLGFFILMPQIGNAPIKSELPPTPATTAYPTTGDITLKVGQKRQLGDLNIELRDPIQDSRCPLGVQCIWAGEIRASIALSNNTHTETISLSSNKKPYEFYGHSVSMISVLPPVKVSTQKILQSEYQITFHIEVPAVAK